MSRKIDMTGYRSGRLTVISEAGRKRNEITWMCKCDCGNTIVVNGYNLRAKITRSCGCLISDATREANTRHKEVGTKLYRAWSNMKNRCNNPNYYLFNHYGGKGIKVCAEWNNYIAFRDWANKNGYVEGLSIDRIDNSKGYSPDNCRWITMKQQQNNRTNNRHITVRGITKTMAEWADCGIKYHNIQAQIGKGRDPAIYIERCLVENGYF